MPAPVTRYTRVASLLHWIMAALMIFMLFFSEDLIKVPRGSSLADWGPSAHASFGILVLLLVIVRLLWRMGNPPPPDLPMSRPQQIASHAIHHSLYALMVLIPIFGLLAIVPYGEARVDVDQVTFFKLFPVAFLPNIGGWTGEVHEILGKIADGLVILHVLGALKHQFWDKDGIMQRISPL